MLFIKVKITKNIKKIVKPKKYLKLTSKVEFSFDKNSKQKK